MTVSPDHLRDSRKPFSDLPQPLRVGSTAPPLIPKPTLFRNPVPALSGRHRLPAHTLLLRRYPESLHPFLIHLSERFAGS